MKNLIASLILLTLLACMPLGQKLLNLEIQQDGHVLLSTSFDVPDTSTESEIWNCAGEAPFSTEVDSVAPSASDPLRAEIQGEVQIRILWTGSLEATATLQDLQLIRSAESADDWHLPAEEVRRAMAAAGL